METYFIQAYKNRRINFHENYKYFLKFILNQIQTMKKEK